MSWSIINKLFTDEPLTGGVGNVIASPIIDATQRVSNERGIISMEVSAAPGGGSVGALFFGGALSQEAPIAAARDGDGNLISVDIAATIPAPFTVSTVDVPILPRMQLNGTLTPGNTVNMSLWLTE